MAVLTVSRLVLANWKQPVPTTTKLKGYTNFVFGALQFGDNPKRTSEKTRKNNQKAATRCPGRQDARWCRFLRPLRRNILFKTAARSEDLLHG